MPKTQAQELVDTAKKKAETSKKAGDEVAAERNKILAELGEMVYGDLVKTETLLHDVEAMSQKDLMSEVTRWDESQQQKWAMFSKFQENGALEMENLVYLELKRIYMMVNALKRKEEIEKRLKQTQTETDNGDQ